jgi:hypothetical protein
MCGLAGLIHLDDTRAGPEASCWIDNATAARVSAGGCSIDSAPSSPIW